MSSSFRGFFLVGSALLIPMTATAQSFEAVVNTACKTHPSIAAANIDLLQADSQIKQAKALFLPTLNSVSEIGVADDRLGPTEGVSDSRPFTSQIIFDQPLYIGGRGRAEVSRAKSQRAGLRYRGISQVIDIQLRAISSYIQLGQSLAVLDVRQDNLEALEQQRSDASRRFELGGGTRSQIVEVDARIARAKGNLVSARTNVEEARISLGEATGLSIKEVVAIPVEADIPTTFKDVVAKALAGNPQIGSADEDIAIADAVLERAKSDRRPQLRLLGDLNIQRDTVFNDFERDEARVRMQLSVPIFAGGRLDSAQKSAALAVSRSTYDKTTLTRRVIEQLQTVWSQLDETRRLIAVNQTLVNSSQQALDAIRKEAFEGFRPSRDVLDAQQEVLEARLSLQQSRFALTQISYNLQASIGEVDASRFPDCANAILTEPKPVRPVREGRSPLELPVIGDIIGVEKGRRRRGPPNRR